MVEPAVGAMLSAEARDYLVGKHVDKCEAVNPNTTEVEDPVVETALP
jgi:hypothetical protein